MDDIREVVVVVHPQVVIIFYYTLKSYNLFGSDFFVFVFLGIAFSSQVGDFIESYVKRNLGVKDTGKIIPGHGGLLDRFDGLIFALPLGFSLTWII